MAEPDIIQTSPLKGISLKLCSVVLFVLMAAMLKAVADRIPAGELVFFRSACGIVPILLWLSYKHRLRQGLTTQHPSSHMLRGIIGTSAMGLNFAALAYLPLPEATAIGYAAPILTVIFAAVLLGERVRLIRISAVALGMAGVLIVLWPQISGTGQSDTVDSRTVGAGFALVGACCSALVTVQIRRMVRTESPTAVAFWFAVTASVLSLITAPFGWVIPTGTEAMLLIGAGLLGGIAQMVMTNSYRLADTSLLAPLEYSSILFALLIGYTVFGDIPTRWTLVGSAVVIAAGILIIFREQALGIERRKQRKAATPQG